MKKKKNSLFQDHIVVNILKPPLKHTLFLLKFIHVIMYFTSGLWWVFVPVCGLSLFAMRGDYSSLQWTCFSLGFCMGSRFQGLQELQFVGSGVSALRLQNTGSAVVAHGLSCSGARGIFTDQGSTQCPLHCEADSTTDHQRSPKSIILQLIT